MPSLCNRSFLVLFSMLIASLAFGRPAQAQGDFLWVNASGGTGDDHANGVVVDGSGNVFAIGKFLEMVDFGGGAIASAGDFDIFVASYDSAGNHNWSRGFGGTSGDEGHGVTVDASGNVTITGQYSGTASFGGGTIASLGGSEMFVAQYDSLGNHIWSHGFGSIGDDIGRGIAVDGLGNVTVTGLFADTVNFGGGAIASAGGSDIFVVQYDNAGNHLWSRRFGDSNTDAGNSVAVDALGNVAVTGQFRETVDFGGGAIASAGVSDIFVAQYDSVGNHLWSRGFGNIESDSDHGIAVDMLAKVTATGEFRDTVDFGSGAIASAGAVDLFMAQYSGISPTLGSGGGGCFIATAAYGTPLAAKIDSLRAVRDSYLLSGPIGTAFVDIYYRIAPPIADMISQNAFFKTIIRAMLVPIVVVSTVTLNAPWLVAGIGLLVSMLFIWHLFCAVPPEKRCETT